MRQLTTPWKIENIYPLASTLELGFLWRFDLRTACPSWIFCNPWAAKLSKAIFGKKVWSSSSWTSGSAGGALASAGASSWASSDESEGPQRTTTRRQNVITLVSINNLVEVAIRSPQVMPPLACQRILLINRYFRADQVQPIQRNWNWHVQVEHSSRCFVEPSEKIIIIIIITIK